MAEIHKKSQLIKKRKSEWHLKKGTHSLKNRSEGGVSAPSKAEVVVKDIGGNILRGFKMIGGAVTSGLKKIGEDITSEEGLKRLGEIGDNANMTFREPLNKEFQPRQKGL